MTSATPKTKKSKPEILLTMVMFLSVSFLRSLPARLILNISAHIFIKRQMEKITIFSLAVLVNDFVAAANHNAIIPGLSVFIRNPVTKRRRWVALPILTPLSSSSLE